MESCISSDISRENSVGDIEMPPLQAPISDGALGDDERTEAEKSPGDKGKPPQGIEDIKEKENRDIVPMSQGSPVKIVAEIDHETVNGRNIKDKDKDKGNNSNSKRQTRRRQKGGKHHRKWKPYHTLSWDERKVLDERETKRAHLKREKRFASGQPMAPYNTTQFLMEQHQPPVPEFTFEGQGQPEVQGQDEHNTSKGDSGSFDSEEDYYDSPNDEEIFMEKEFAETYQSFHAERMQTMSKDDLIREYIELESKLDKMEVLMKDLKGDGKEENGDGKGENGDPLSSPSKKCGDRLPNSERNVDISQAKTLQDQVMHLKLENCRLRKENAQLKARSRSKSV